MRRGSAAAVPIAAAALLLLAPAPGSAQAPGQGRLFLTGGLQVLDVAELNQRLRARGLPTFSEERLALGLGIDRRVGPWLLGAEGALLPAEETSAGGLRRSLGARYGVLQAGFLLPLASGLRVYPLAGVGLGSVELTTSGGDAVGFDDVLDGPVPGSEVGTGGLMLQGGLGVDLAVGGVTVGVRGGYTFTPGAAEWSRRGETVEDAPDVGLEGAFLRAVLAVVD